MFELYIWLSLFVDKVVAHPIKHHKLCTHLLLPVDCSSYLLLSEAGLVCREFDCACAFPADIRFGLYSILDLVRTCVNIAGGKTQNLILSFAFQGRPGLQGIRLSLTLLRVICVLCKPSTVLQLFCLTKEIDSSEDFIQCSQ